MWPIVIVRKQYFYTWGTWHIQGLQGCFDKIIKIKHKGFRVLALKIEGKRLLKLKPRYPMVRNLMEKYLYVFLSFFYHTCWCFPAEAQIFVVICQ